MKNIPKVCHMCWVGSQNMPLLTIFTLISFHRFNPDWKIIFYRSIQNSDDIGKYPYSYNYTGSDYFYLIKGMDYVEIKIIDLTKYNGPKSNMLNVHTPGLSDILRINILYEEGGAWSDSDIIWLKPMSEIANIDCIGDPNDFECNVIYYNQTHGHQTSSFFIAEKGSLYLKSIIDEQDNVTYPYEDCAFSTILYDKMYPTLDCAISKFPRILAMKYETIFPYSVFNMKQLWEENDLTPLNSKNVLGLHWFNGQPLSKEYTNNGFRENCSMTSLLKREGYIK